MRVHWVQHVGFEGPATIGAWARDRGHTLSHTLVHAGEPLPALDAFDLLVVMGGPMNVYEDLQHPWLAGEREFLRQAVDAGKAVLGICLGAQLLSVALGGRVEHNRHQEVGWHEVNMTEAGAALPLFREFPRRFEAFHWHGDTFTIPPGAVHAARSRACENQAFVLGDRVVGLQFHLETSSDSLGELIENCCQELGPGEYIQTAEEMLSSPERLDGLRTLSDALLDRMAGR